MKVLVVTPPCHFKNAGAAQRDIYSTLKLLKKMGHQVAMYTVDSPSQDQNTLTKVGREHGVAVRKFRPVGGTLSRLKSLVLSWPLLDGAAYVFASLVKNSDFINYVKDWRPDTVISFCSYSWPVISFCRDLGIPAVLRSHNLESDFFWESLSGFAKFNPLNLLRYYAKQAGEKRAVKYANAVATLPFEGIKYYYKWKQKKVFIFTLAFLPESLRQPQIHLDKQIIDCFYLGASYNVVFHLRGAEKLIEKIAPQVLEQAVGKFRFNILGGKLPDRLVKQCDGQNIIYHGYVDNLDEFLNKMDVGVFPVQTGKTMKGKVFETLARAFPMVIPANCLGGYNLKDGEEVFIADRVEQNVAKILQLRAVETRRKLATGAYKFSQNNFSEQSLVDVLTKVLSE